MHGICQRRGQRLAAQLRRNSSALHADFMKKRSVAKSLTIADERYTLRLGAIPTAVGTGPLIPPGLVQVLRAVAVQSLPPSMFCTLPSALAAAS